jgi:hypothetical protein
MEREQGGWITLTKDTATDGLRPFAGKIMAFQCTRLLGDTSKDLFQVNKEQFCHFKWQPQWQCFNLLRFITPSAEYGFWSMDARVLGAHTLRIREATAEEVAALRAAWEAGEAQIDYCSRAFAAHNVPWQ